MLKLSLSLLASFPPPQIISDNQFSAPTPLQKQKQPKNKRKKALTLILIFPYYYSISLLIYMTKFL